MASFFQPGVNDPAIAACSPQRFEIYCNSILSSSERLKSWHQLVTLIVGCVAVAVPLVVILFRMACSFGGRLNSKFSR